MRRKGYEVSLVWPDGPSFTGDEAEFRRILRDTPMDGAIRMTFTREPHLFGPGAAPSVCHPFLVRRVKDGEVCMVCALTTMPVYWRGGSATVAYLNLLRVLPAFRGGVGLLRAGYAAMKSFRKMVCPEGPCFTSIVADNTKARRLLEAGIKGLPEYAPLRGLETLAMSTRPGRRTGSLSPATAADVPELAAFYAARYAGRDLAPHLGEDWFRSLGTQACPDLRIKDFFLYRRGGAIAGSVALWDQRATRQSVVTGYVRSMAFSRPFYNAWAYCTGRPVFPGRGEIVNAAYLAFAAFAPEAAGAITDCVHDALRLLRERGVAVALLGDPRGVGLSEKDFVGVRYRSMLYAVRWPDESSPGPMPGPEVRPEAALL